MRSIWIGIDPRPDVTRVLAMASPTEILLEARLGATARHARAVPSLLEALALWEGTPVRAAVAVDGTDDSCATRLCLDPFGDGAPPLYSLAYVPRQRRGRRRGDALGGGRDFRNLRQLFLFEEAR